MENEQEASESPSEDVKETEAQEVAPEEDTEEEVAPETAEEDELEEAETPRAEKRIRQLVAERDAALDLLRETRDTRPLAKEQEEVLPPMDDPELEAAIESRIASRTKKLETFIGKTLEELDEVRAVSQIPNYKKVADQVDVYRRKTYRNEGQYLTRTKAYKLMVAEGLIREPKVKTIIKKSHPTVAAVRTTPQATSRGKVSSQDFKSLSLADKEKKLENLVL